MKGINVYIADCCKTGGIYHFNLANKKLVLQQKIAADRPMYLAVNEKRLYAILRSPFSDNDRSGIVYYEIGDDGILSGASIPITTEGTVSCHLCVNEDNIFDANYLSGSVNKLGVKTVVHKGKGSDPKRQEAPHVHYTNISPDGKYVLCCDLGLDTVFVYDLNLNQVSNCKVPDGHGVRHLAYSDDGETVYSVNELASTISVFEYSNGILTYCTTVNALPEDFNGDNTAAAIRVSGDKLLVSHRGLDGICVFDITNRIPEYITSFMSYGKSPRDFDIIGECIIVTNESGTVSVFDSMSYSLLQTVELDSPLCVIYK